MNKKQKKLLVLFLLAGILVAAMVLLCFSDTIRLHLALNRYNSFLDEQIPEGTTLTIYYVPNSTIFRSPPTVEGLINMAEENHATKIVVRSDALTKNLQSLKQLITADLQPMHEDTFVYARVYYVLEKPNGETILDVALWAATNEDFQFGFFVNGILVINHPVFLDILVPFLSEEDLEALGITPVPEGAVNFGE